MPVLNDLWQWQPSKNLDGGEEVLDGDLHVVDKGLSLLGGAVT